ncbi:Protein kinase-like domain protein [Niveomyces insectorum RCEF 264]|uniref:Protein kinase-like domain protein n=1 Tax=Niveomyces insectorum RCEF 264 TaxID=1081102 RepID=A0A167MMD3_9HYPO|nr:Protein kinase-like domain protein [Niveomyces insectorum RCEF 264]
MDMEFVPKPQHPLAVFRLNPLNGRAREVVANPNNKHLVSGEGPKDLYLDIGGIPSAVNDGVTLATLGRHGDVHIEGASVARVQCAFEMDPVSQVVMLYDKSHNNSTQVHDMDCRDDNDDIDDIDNDDDFDNNDNDNKGNKQPTVWRFEYGRPRKVYVGPFVNSVLGMCGVDQRLILFRLVWPQNAQAALARKARSYVMTGLAHVSHLAKTLDDTETAPETTRVTRLHTPALGTAMLIRYYELGNIGEGSFGVVCRAINVDTGRIMAVKRLKRLPSNSAANWEKCRREVMILAKLRHPCIVDLIWSKIFVGLKDGSLDKLVLSGSYAASAADAAADTADTAAANLPPLSLHGLASRMFDHMLQALDFLACEGIVHRDVKPENIFYVRRAGAYHFQLGDFGLSNFARLAVSQHCGTPIYMSPEVYSGGGRQTPKADVWSLFVTLLWTLDYNDFRARSDSFGSYRETCAAVQALAADPRLVPIRAMAAAHPDRRASAAQMLCANFAGSGLTTPRNLVPPLAEPEPPAPQPSLSPTPAPTLPPPPSPPVAAPVPKRVPQPVTNPGDAAVETAAVSAMIAEAIPSPSRPPTRWPVDARPHHQRQGPTTGAAVLAGDNTRVQKRRYKLRDRDAVRLQAAVSKPPGVSVNRPSSDTKMHSDTDMGVSDSFPAF